MYKEIYKDREMYGNSLRNQFNSFRIRASRTGKKI